MNKKQSIPFINLENDGVEVVLRMLILIAAVMSGLIACTWASSTSAAVDVVERYLEAKMNNDFTAWKSTLWAAQKDGSNFTPSFEKPGDLGVLNLSIGEVAVSDQETARIQKRYSGSDLAKTHGWSETFIAENMLAVTAEYTVEYDNTRVPYPDGEQIQVFYLLRDDPASPWLIWDFGSPSH